MRNKIQKGMFITIGTILIFSLAIIVIGIYRDHINDLKEEVRQESGYIALLTNQIGEEFITGESFPHTDSRITLIEPDGTVIYDSKNDYKDMENHGDREEIIGALADGEGEGERFSSTRLEDTFYYANLLKNGNVLRISKETDSIVATTLNILPLAIAVGIGALLIAAWISRKISKRLVDPLMFIDLDNPLNNKTYVEIYPLLERIEKNNKIREEGEAMRREFSANVSHELKTPLTSISGYAEIIKNGIASPEDIQGFSEKIYVEANRLIVLIDDILKLSRLDEGGLDKMKEEMDLYNMTRDIVSRLSLQVEEKNINVEIVGEPIKYMGVKQIIDEMIYNIVENAIKYNRENGKIKIWVGGTLEGAKLIVSDTGVGIKEEEHNRVFERFYRADKSHSKKTGGTGLGLSIVKHGAALHEIDIELKSKLGEGTTVELKF